MQVLSPLRRWSQAALYLFFPLTVGTASNGQSDFICCRSDVHITADDVIIMFHDPSLGRTTDGKGLIKNQNWNGNIENIRTLKEPVQQIPTFHQACELLMRPENQHVKFNVSL